MDKIIAESNKLIADFMGIKIGVDSYSWRPGVIDLLTEGNLNYHGAWGWLMPVVEKIESMGYEVQIGKHLYKKDTNSCIIHDAGNALCIEFEKTGVSKIINTFLAIVEFIKWQNTKTKK